ncbi:Metal-dependent transcriptional regulator [Alteracholeplasma palmae J233]|uniref:Manganese transport regulator n=1 Tax=Alteracholeplasma palmae (strain ATCC 49389 / J233) TaxID=1318466 RepID=U4KKL2_ALTPJ|nr:metal-dependent transcriptional regulator [Alteracholeplasma palmae]CCV64143.1 Metal-dependent transcriptional regulator [Alteracholeplasma palmae J233]
MYRAEEDYLKLIYELSVEQNKPLIKNNEIAEAFGYTDQSVNEMVKKLVNKKLVKFEPYKGVSLTEKGNEEAIRMIRAHRIWEVFLTKELKISWQDVHEDAEKLEHASSEALIEKLYKYLGNPEYCQHGNPIPDINGNIKEIATLTLAETNEGDTFMIKRVLDHKELLKYLDERGIHLEMELKVVKKDSFNGYLKVEVDGKVLPITERVSHMLFGIKHQ